MRGGLDPGGLLAVLVWRPAVGAWLLAALLLGVAVALRRAWVLLRTRVGGRRAAVLLALRGTVLAGLVALLLDPACERRSRARTPRRLVVVVDRSGSMDVADRGDRTGSRFERAAALAERIVREAPGDPQVLRFAADTGLEEAREWRPSVRSDEDAPRGTDLSTALVRLAEDPRVRTAAAVVLLSDGGDAAIEPARMPEAPLLVVALGGDPEQWRDVSVAAVRSPDRVEAGARVQVEVSLRARGAGYARFAEGLRAVRVVLEKEQAGQWEALGEQSADVSGGTAEVRFETPAGEPGNALWRARAVPVPGELSDLNNVREFPVEVAADALRILYFSRRLGADLKFLRQELSADPSVSFSTLVQTAGNQFLLQGDARAWDELAAPDGLPPLATLKRFDGVVLGSFPAAEWTLPEMEALRTYVEEGGGLLWVGGEDSFDTSYAASPLGELIPWRAGTAEGFLRTPAAVAPAPDGAWRWAGVFESPAEGVGPPEVQALNRAGPLKAGALAWLEARTAQGTMPFLVEQPYGRGRVFALASNTTWRWALAGPPRDRLYRQLWRQAVRAVAGQGEVEGNLRVRFEPEKILPGRRVGLEVDVLDATPQSGVAARLEGPDGVEVIGLARDTAVSGRWRGTLVCRSRGLHRLTVQALDNGLTVETLERTVAVAPGEREGGRLETDHGELERLALRGGGLAIGEDADGGAAWLAARLRPEVSTQTLPLVSSGPWFLLALLVVWMVEWTLRRRSNLV